MSLGEAPGAGPRAVCMRCRRPRSVCYCDQIPRLPTRTRVVLLQHARERHKAIGTARMAHLALSDSILRVGVDFAADTVVRSLLEAPAPPYVLFPGRDALDVATLPRDRPITLIVLDGTWWQARKLLKLNPALAALPRVAFAPTRPSEYRIRRQPAAACVSTVEALVEVLRALEPEGAAFERLLDPFRVMIDRQIACAEEVRAGLRRSRHQEARARRPAARRLSQGSQGLGERLAALWPRLVCVQGEANAWGRLDPERREPEIVHYVAERLATGERFEAVIAPRGPLGAATPLHVELAAERLLAGQSVALAQAGWERFRREGDVVVHWGAFYERLAEQAGLAPVGERIDLRAALSRQAKRRLGPIEQGLAWVGGATDREGVSPSVTALEGRAGRRLQSLVALVRRVRDTHLPGA